MILPDDDVVGHLVDPVFPVAEALRASIRSGRSALFRVAFEQFGIALGAGVDPHLQGPDHLQLGDLIDQRIVLRPGLPWLALSACPPSGLSGPFAGRRSFPAGPR